MTTWQHTEIVVVLVHETFSGAKKNSMSLEMFVEEAETCFKAYRDNLIIQMCNKITNSIRYAPQNFAQQSRSSEFTSKEFSTLYRIFVYPAS